MGFRLGHPPMYRMGVEYPVADVYAIVSQTVYRPLTGP
ncbi:hypothetical protein QFZ67_003609 [Streptomyces sp. V1I1]|nr:hypothetical protein [Streptomyces sp. V1I1]